MEDEDINVILFWVIGIVILYFGFLKSNSLFNQAIDFLKKSLAGKIILIVLGVSIVVLFILLKVMIRYY